MRVTAVHLKLNWNSMIALERIIARNICDFSDCTNHSQRIVWWTLWLLQQRLWNKSQLSFEKEKSFRITIQECYALHLWLGSIALEDVYYQTIRSEIFAVIDRRLK